MDHGLAQQLAVQTLGDDFGPGVLQALRRVEIRMCATEAELARFAGPLQAGTRGMFLGTPMHAADDLELDDEEAERIPPSGFIFLISANLADADDLRLTLYHEVGHALGLDESEVAALGLSHANRLTEGRF